MNSALLEFRIPIALAVSNDNNYKLFFYKRQRRLFFQELQSYAVKSLQKPHLSAASIQLL